MTHTSGISLVHQYEYKSVSLGLYTLCADSFRLVKDICSITVIPRLKMLLAIIPANVFIHEENAFIKHSNAREKKVENNLFVWLKDSRRKHNLQLTTTDFGTLQM